MELFENPVLNSSTFKKFQEFIHKRAGITVNDEKTEFLKGRLFKRLRAVHLNTFEAYYDYLCQSSEEFTQFINAITTNVTHFFREENHFHILKDKILPELLHKDTIRIWSAACSNGAEPYSIAILVNEFFEQNIHNKYPKVEITASDLSMEILSDAIIGVYDEELMRNVKPELLKKYFKKGLNSNKGKYKINKSIREKVNFFQHNLLNIFPAKNKYDVVFCRNVMIYFDSNVKEKVVGNIFEVLNKGGYLFTGHSESIINLSKKTIAPSVYVNL